MMKKIKKLLNKTNEKHEIWNNKKKTSYFLFDLSNFTFFMHFMSFCVLNVFIINMEKIYELGSNMHFLDDSKHMYCSRHGLLIPC